MIADPVAEGLRLLEVVRREHDRPPVSRSPEIRSQQRSPGGRIEAGRRLVEEDELRDR